LKNCTYKVNDEALEMCKCKGYSYVDETSGDSYTVYNWTCTLYSVYCVP